MATAIEVHDLLSVPYDKFETIESTTIIAAINSPSNIALFNADCVSMLSITLRATAIISMDFAMDFISLPEPDKTVNLLTKPATIDNPVNNPAIIAKLPQALVNPSFGSKDNTVKDAASIAIDSATFFIARLRFTHLSALRLAPKPSRTLFKPVPASDKSGSHENKFLTADTNFITCFAARIITPLPTITKIGAHSISDSLSFILSAKSLMPSRSFDKLSMTVFHDLSLSFSRPSPNDSKSPTTTDKPL